MPKYRFLNDEELRHLEVEFKQFLIVNQVYAGEWEDLNRDTPDKALELAGLFSDQVLQRVYEKIRFLERRSTDSCFVFRFDDEQAHLKVMQAKEGSPADLSTPESIHEALQRHFDKLSFYKSSKKYSLKREEEIHRTLSQGASVSTSGFWEMLEKIIP